MPETDTATESNNGYKFIQHIIRYHRGKIIKLCAASLIPRKICYLVVRAIACKVATKTGHTEYFYQFKIYGLGIMDVPSAHVLAAGYRRTAEASSIQVLRCDDNGVVNTHKVNTQYMAFFHAILIANAYRSAHAVATGIGDLQPMADTQ